MEADCGYAFGKRPFRPFVVETSLLNCYGLQALSTFLHIPFLCLKRASLEQAMQLNTHAIVQAQEALKTVKGSRYDEYERRIEAATGAKGSASVARATRAGTTRRRLGRARRGRRCPRGTAGRRRSRGRS